MTTMWRGMTGGGRRLAAMALVVLGLAACGGGTQVERFVPNRVIALGDENSVIQADGRKFTVNGFNSAVPPVLDCTVNPIWIQYVAGLWGILFDKCPNGAATTAGRIYAADGAKVADLAAQITAAGTLGEKDMVTVFVGINDILDLYAQYPVRSEAALIVDAQNAGAALAAQVYAITRTGARVVFLTLPELGSTPYARKQDALNAGRAALLTRLSAAFNTKLRTSVSSGANFIDGHQGVQVLADTLFHDVIGAIGTSSTTYVNGGDGICDAALAPNVIDCTTNTLLQAAGTTPLLTAGGTPSTYVWADDEHLSPGGHATLGVTAATRINANPL